MASNTAAWITAPKAAPFEVKPAPLGTPEENQILVKNHAIAINPVDGKIQYDAIFPLKYPTILGQDVAGEVVAVGPHVTRFKKGDRVIGVAAGFHSRRDEEKAFQEYTILRTNMSCEIPDAMPFENGVVLPLGIAAASSALFNTDFFNLALPTEPRQKPNGKALLIWGGASSVGSCAIQLSTAAGYEVITTASPNNFDYVKKLGASQVFDYKSPTVVSDLVNAFEGKASLGAFDTIGHGAWVLPIEFVQKSKGPRFVVTVTPGWEKNHPEEVTMKQGFAPAIKDNHVGKAIFEDYLPKALRNGTFVTAPEPLIAGKGLESLQTGVDLLYKGVSARKVVILL